LKFQLTIFGPYDKDNFLKFVGVRLGVARFVSQSIDENNTFQSTLFSSI